MLAISTGSSDKTSINILPCRIHHTGPTRVTKRYWQPKIDSDGHSTSHFRGRRLRGRVVKLPTNYQGLVLKTTNKTMVEPIIPADEDEEPELPEPVKVIEEVSKFDEIIFWGHDRIPQSDEDLVKGIEEWISLATAIHTT